MMLPFSRLLLLQLALAISACHLAQNEAFAQSAKQSSKAPPPSVVAEEIKPAPYDNELSRLSEILGSLQYIEGLCKSAIENDWRTDMAALIKAEAAGEPPRQERFTAAYNRGFRTFAAVYTECTENAKLAEKSYRREGATLSQEITSRFGN